MQDKKVITKEMLNEIAHTCTDMVYPFENKRNSENYCDYFEGFKAGYVKAEDAYNKRSKIDEDYLDKLAADDALRARVLKDANYSVWYLVTETFKAGYRKAMEDFYRTEG